MGRRNRFTLAQDARLIELMAQGMPSKVICAEFSLTQDAYYKQVQRLRESGVAIPKRGRGRVIDWTPELTGRLMQGYAAGLSYRALAPALGISVGAVRMRVHALKTAGTLPACRKPVRLSAPRRRRESAAMTHYSPRKSRSERPCMCCARPFASTGAMNRLCVNCKNRNVSPFAP